jgi:hypothetical protein
VPTFPPAPASALAPALAPAALLVASTVFAAMVQLAPISGQPVAALFPPWWSNSRAFAAAAATGGAIVRTGAWPTLLVVASASPRLTERLRSAGAWLILNPQALGACTSPPVRASL